MSPVQELHDPASAPAAQSGELEITAAAIEGYRRLLGAVGHRVHTYAARDGGLICEDRTASPARPRMWRIQGDGMLVADTPYNFLLHAFVQAGLPAAARAEAA